MDSENLPEGWANAQLEQIVDILDSMRIPVNNDERQARIAGKAATELFPYFGATGQVGEIDGYLFDEQLIALGEDGVPFFDPLKPKAYLLEGKTWVNNHAHVLRATHGVSTNKYVLNYLNQFDYQGYVNGGTRLKLTQANMRKIYVRLPPLAEQKVIAEKLDTLLAQVETTKAHLERIPEIIKRFRQSVLAAAVSGRLTEEWRVENGHHWESLTIGDLGEVKGGKRLPEGDELVEQNTGFPYIRAGQLKLGTVISTDEARSRQLYLTPEAQSKISRYTVNVGDLYITIVGASIGDAGVIPERYTGANLTENAAKITDFKKPLNSNFLSYWLRSQELQDLIKMEIKSGAQGKLALKRIKELPAPYTDIKEQTEIVRRVEQLFAFADTIEQKANAALDRVNNLTQSILAKAFHGELTAEWRAANPDLISGENSAEALLERIKVERAGNVGRKRR